MNNQTKNKSILIADDDTTLREALVFDFKRKGYKVFSAENGSVAFEIIKKEKIDIVVTDIRMPIRTGIELLDNIKELDSNIAVVVFISEFGDLTLEDAYHKGACAVMSKPFDRKILFETVQRSLQTYSEKFTNSSNTPSSNLQVSLKTQDHLSQPQPTQLLSMGQGGMFLASTEINAKINETIAFKIQATPEYPIRYLQGQGIVRWIRAQPTETLPSGMGIEFTFLDEECRQEVIRFLENLHPKAFIPKAA